MNKKLVLSFYLILISPLLSLIIHLKLRSRAYLHLFLTIVVSIYSSILIIGQADGKRHLDNVYFHYTDLSFFQFFDELILIITFNPPFDVKGDIFIHIYSYLLALLHLEFLFFFIVGLIYGYFFSGVVVKILFPKNNGFDFNNKISFPLIHLYFVFIFIFLLGFAGVVTVRTWTGMWILLYAVVSYYESYDKRYLGLLILPPMFHVGFFAMAVPTLVIVFLGTRFKLLYVIIFVLSFVGTLNKEQALQGFQTTEIGGQKAELYYVEDEESFMEERVEEDQTFYKKYERLRIEKYAIYIIVFSLIITNVYFRNFTMLEQVLFSCGLLTAALSNIFSFIFALSFRSMTIAEMFFLATIVLLLRRNIYYFNKCNTTRYIILAHQISMIIMIPLVLYLISKHLQFTSIYFFGLPFIPWFFEGMNISIREAMNWIL